MGGRFFACPRGYRMTFDNGYAVSVQWNHGNYCENRSTEYVGVNEQDGIARECANAECAIIYNDQIIGDVIGWQTPDDVARLIARTAKRKPRT